MQPTKLFFFLVVFTFFSLSSTQKPSDKLLTNVISLKNSGDIRGYVQVVNNSTQISTYIGIPYGQIEGRFARPVKTQPWKGVKEVTRFRFACPQIDIPFDESSKADSKLASQTFENANQTKFSSEDCLFLNVWSPRKLNSSSENSTTPLAVMVWIHDSTESRDYLISRSTIFSKVFDGKNLAATGNVVVVSVAYRVGVFGHLYLPEVENGTSQANAGLYDLIEALKWVQENIALFNGDPQRVTIFGDSSGAEAVGVLLLSPQTEGLFQRAILQSGSPLTKVENAHTALAKTRLLGSMVGCLKPNQKTSLSKCLQTKPVEEILNASQAMADVGLHFKPVFGLNSSDELLPENPLNLLLEKKFNKKVDLLFGTTANEGSPAVYDFYPQLDVNESLTLEEAEQVIANLMLLLRVPFLEEVLDFYLDGLTTSSHHANDSQLRGAIEAAYGDLITVSPLALFADLLHQQELKGKFYAYRLEEPLPVSTSGCLPWMGVCSGSTVDYVFGVSGFENEEFSNVKNLSFNMMTAWSSFAETGEPKFSPEVKWTEAFSENSTDKMNFMALKVGAFQMKVEEISSTGENFCSGVSFWKDKLVSMFST